MEQPIHQLKMMTQTMHEGYEPFNGIVMKYGNLVRQACLARNSITLSLRSVGDQEIISHLRTLNPTSSLVILQMQRLLRELSANLPTRLAGLPRSQTIR